MPPVLLPILPSFLALSSATAPCYAFRELVNIAIMAVIGDVLLPAAGIWRIRAAVSDVITLLTFY